MFSSHIATINSKETKRKTIKKDEKLVKWKPVKKLEGDNKFKCKTCPYGDHLESLNKDIEKMKTTLSKVYMFQERKQNNKTKKTKLNIQKNNKKNNKIKKTQINIQKNKKENKKIRKKDKKNNKNKTNNLNKKKKTIKKPLKKNKT